MSGKSYSFRDILNEGLELESGEVLAIHQITIPRIQRAYAQGRKCEEDLRTQFVDELFEHLINDEAIEMNYVYGSTPEADIAGEHDLELLDGQQRLTTLFLFHWYIANRELDSIPQELGAFSYQTRTTTTDFIKHLVARKIEIAKTPSASIKALKWYTHSFDNDATIVAMLRMLDAIHAKYTACGASNLYDKLDNLRFYALPLEGFGLSEELYIKMNARGLELTPFENFKSDLVKYMKGKDQYTVKDKLGDHELLYYMKFAAKIDSLWVDLFWDKNNVSSKEYCQKFFRFFYRYFMMKYALDTKADMQAKDLLKDEGLKFFDVKSELGQTKRYLRFGDYQNVLDAHQEIDYFRKMEAILDLLHAKYAFIRPLLQNPFDHPEEDTENWWDFYNPTRDGGASVKKAYTRINGIILCAVFEYIESSMEEGKSIEESFDEANFRRWMRIVWNAVENTNIDNISSQVLLMRRLREVIKLPNATKDIYTALAAKETSGNENRSIVEEVVKAKQIINHPEEDWEAIFREAEMHEFLRGMIGFFFTPDISADAFRKRFDNINKMIDKEGIMAPYSDNAILLRAILSEITSWEGGLANLTFTARVEKNKNLKNILASQEPVRELFRTICDMPELDIIPYLEAETKKPVRVAVPAGGRQEKLQLAYEKLRSDVKLHEWMSLDELNKNKTPFRVQWLGDDRVTAHMPNKWYSIAMLDSDRDAYAYNLSVDKKLIYADQEQAECFKKYGLSYGYGIELMAYVNGFSLRVWFNEKVTTYVFVNNQEDVSRLHKVFSIDKDTEIKTSSYFKIDAITMDYQTQYADILNLVEDACKKLNTAPAPAELELQLV